MPGAGAGAVAGSVPVPVPADCAGAGAGAAAVPAGVGADVEVPPAGGPCSGTPGDGGAVLPEVGCGVAPGVVFVPAAPAGVALGSALMTAMICSLYALSRAWISESGWFRRS